MIDESAIVTISHSTLALSGALRLHDQGDLTLINSSVTAAEFDDPGGYGAGGTLFNPSHVAISGAATFDEKLFVFGLGGTLPASVGNTGGGHYATFVADTISLAGTLIVDLFYGFTPTVGQEFQILTALTSRDGFFSNATEGDIVAVFDDVGLRITKWFRGFGAEIVVAPRYAAIGERCRLASSRASYRRRRRGLRPRHPLSDRHRP